MTHDAPRTGDVILRRVAPDGQWCLYDATSGRLLRAPITERDTAIALASVGDRGVWEQPTDHRGRPLGTPIRVRRAELVAS